MKAKTGQSSKIQEMIAAQAEHTRRLRETTAADLLAAFREVFEAHPSVKAVTWTQYTQNWNDGEPCTFDVYAEDPCRGRMPCVDDFYAFGVQAGSEPELDETPYPKQQYGEGYFDSEGFKSGVSKDDGAAVHAFLRSLPDDFMQFALGDGVQVFVWSGGLLTRGYDHD